MGILGLGLDICSVERMQRILEGPRAERFLARVFTPAERELCEARSEDRKSTRLNSSHSGESRMPSSA